jgi:putative hydrolase of the HAD superfamily
MNSFEGIQAVSFDVGGTLIEPWPSVGHVYAAVAAQHGVSADPDRLNHQFALAWNAKSAFDYSRRSWSQIVSRTFDAGAPALEEMPFFDELYESFSGADVWRIHEDVLPTLEALLDRGLKLAIISNWDERLRPLLTRLKLDGYFDIITISSEIGFHKPSPVIFEEAVKKLGLPSSAVLHVGDSLEEDIHGARRAGLKAVRVDRQRRQTQTDQVNSLHDLSALIT